MKTTFKRQDRGKNFKYWLVFLLLTAVLVPSVWLLVSRMEGDAPGIDLEIESRHIRTQSVIPVHVSDAKSGIRNVRAVLIKDGSEFVLMETGNDEIDSPGKRIDFVLSIDTKTMGLTDGKALLRIEAVDRSWRNWLSGNRTQVEKEFLIDTTVPRITVLSRQHNVTRGGAGLVIYRLSELCEKHGIAVGDDFFPGHPGNFPDKELYIAFFALRHDQGPGTDLHVEAVDPAGNMGRSGFYHYIRDKRFAAETLPISDAFLRRILPSFPPGADIKPDVTPVEHFLYINRELRNQNNATILANGRSTDETMHWEHEFLRLPNSAPKAAFADHRTYSYNGETIDQAYHLGIDLASVQQAPVPAANKGRVAFIDHIGIYGLTAIIDHGFGLFSIYSHLSRTEANPGDLIGKGDILGYTGTTGLAGGDHLHYGIFIDHVFVNPVEWWDPAWIKNNVTDKLEDAKVSSGG